MRIRLLIISFILITLLSLTVPYTSLIKAQQSSVRTPHGFEKIIESLNKTAIMEHVRFFSSLGSRVTGYPGFFKAAEYIVAKLREYGVQPYGDSYFEYFNITVPIDKGCYVELENGTKIKAYALWPNLVNPSPYESPEEGDILVYIGKGTFEELKGINVEGKFVLMDFNSRWYYKIPLLHGAKGVIFVPEIPELIMRPEAEQKLLLIPLPFPRLYVPLEEGGEQLLRLCKSKGSEGIRVHIRLNMQWESIQVPNIVGFVKGTDPELSEEIAVITAFYDSWSIVPAISPGATDSLGIAFLLEFAKYLAQNPPRRSALIVALAGHWEALWGAREFVERHFDELDRIVMFAGLDLASDSNTVALCGVGYTYSFIYQYIVNSKYSWLVNKLFQIYLPEMRMIFGPEYGTGFVDAILLTHPPYIQTVPPYDPGTYSTLGMVYFTYYNYLRASSFMFDSDPFVVATYGSGFTFHTINAFRRFQKTPIDTFDRIKFENLWPQAYFIACSLWGLLNEETILLFRSPARLKDDWGYATLNVLVSEYNMLTAYYDPINETRRPELWDEVLVYVQHGNLFIVSKINRKGIATIHGLKPYLMTTVDAFVVNSTNGHIEWATDTGVFMAPGGKTVSLTTSNYTKILSIFPCAMIAVISTYNPFDFRAIPSLFVYNARAHGPMIRQGFFQADIDYVAFVDPGVPAEIVFSMGEKIPICVLHNASAENPIGTGFVLSKGETLILGPDDIARELYYLTYSRYSTLASYYSLTPTLEIYQRYSSKYFNELIRSLNTNEFDKVYGLSYHTWAFTLGSYSSMMDYIWQVILTISVFFAITIPFAIITERLLLGYSGLKRVIAMVAIIALSNITLYLVHPGYVIATNSVVVLLSVGLLVMVLPLLAFIINESISSAKALRARLVGHHFAEISRSGFFAASASAGIEGMKRRRLRTTMTFISVVIIVFAMVTFASLTISPQLLSGSTATPPSYEGVLIRAEPWAPLPEECYLSLKSLLHEEAKIVPRGWLYAPAPPMTATLTEATGLPIIIFSPKRISHVTALLAVTPEEAKVSGIDKLLIRGRWFTKDDVFSIIIPKELAVNLTKELGREITVGSTISLWGLDLKVVGIYMGPALSNIFDPDGEAITPVNLQAGTLTAPPHFDGREIAIIPYELYSRIVYPTSISDVALKPLRPEIFDSLISELPLRVVYNVYYGSPEEGGIFIRARQWFTPLGMQMLIVPLIIATLTLLTVMLGSVYEKMREIKIYNAVGMAPSHISTMFLIEALSYTIPSAFTGYILGIVATNIMIRIGAYPAGFYPNFSSLIVLIVVGMAALTILLSALYPSMLIAKLAVPSMVRRWHKAIIRPKGDVWEIPLPLAVPSLDELLGVLEFIREYLVQYSVARETKFYTEKVTFSVSKEGEVPIYALIANIRLPPYDLGILQETIFQSTYERRGLYGLRLVLRRVSGYRASWMSSSTIFVDDVRKQILIWRTMPISERAKYIKAARELLQNVSKEN